MTASAFTPPPQDARPEELWRAIAQVVYAANGSTSWQRLWTLTGAASDDEFLVTLENQGTGGHLNVPGLLQVEDDGVTVGADLTVDGGIQLDGHLTWTTDNAFDIGASGAHRPRDLFVARNAGIGGNLGVSGTLGVTLGATFSSTVLVSGSATLGDANADAHTVVGSLTVRNETPAVQLFSDAANNRVIVGSSTALTSATDDKLSVVGGSLYVAANSAVTAVGVRNRSSNTGSFFFGASNSNTPDGVLSNASGTQIARLFTGGGLLIGTATALTSTEKLEVSSGGLRVQAGGIVLAGSGNIDGNSGTAGQLRIGGVIVNTASFSGSEVLRVAGDTRLEGNVTITGVPTLSGLTWTTFAPSVTQSAGLTMSVNYARYAVLGKIALVQIYMTYNSGASVAGNNIQITGIPSAIQPARTGSNALAGVFAFWDNSAATYYVGAAAMQSSTTVVGYRDGSGGVGMGISPNVAIAASDFVTCNLSYELA